MLIERTLFGTVDKIADSIKLLRDNEPPEGYYVCFSGGKDSTCILELVKLAGVKFDAHYQFTDIEPPEAQEFIRCCHPEVVWDYPPTSMAELIVKNVIPPMRFAQYCCRCLKRCFGKGRVKVTGIRAGESHGRKLKPPVDKLKDGTVHVNPILKWSTADVWQFIHENNLPYCSLYDEGFARVGCVLCPNQTKAQTERDLKRFPTVVEYYRNACRKSFEANQDKFTGERKSRHWKSGDDLFNWWVHERHSSKTRDSGCGSLFDRRNSLEQSHHDGQLDPRR